MVSCTFQSNGTAFQLPRDTYARAMFGTDYVAAASQMAQQMNQMGGAQGPQMFGPGVDPDKQFLAEAENLAVIEHYSVLDDVEKRLLEGIKA
jgi:hypothetical protein